MRARYLLVLGLAAVAVVGEVWHLRTTAGDAHIPLRRTPVLAGPGPAAVPPTAVDEGDLSPPSPGVLRGPRASSGHQRRLDLRSARTPSFAPSPRPSLGSPSAPSVPVKKAEEPSPDISDTSSPPQAAPPPEAVPEDQAEPAAAPPTPALPVSPAAESGAAGSTSPSALAGGGHPASPSDLPPHLTPPRVIDTAGAAYPGDAFSLTVRRQDLGSELAVQGAEGTVALRALISADGSVRTVDIAASSGSPVLDRAAAETVRLWRFAPATRDGVPIDAYALLHIRYVVR